MAIIDADKEGFLRSERSLIQTAGRAARNANGAIVMYADTITGSMQKMMNETDRRRKIQLAWNENTTSRRKPSTNRTTKSERERSSQKNRQPTKRERTGTTAVPNRQDRSSTRS